MSAVQAREQHRADVRSRILDAARASFIHEGYKSFSLRKLAKQIEYSPAAIYKHFKNKNEIFECLRKESFDALITASLKLAVAPDENPVDRLKRGMQAYVDFGLKNPDQYRLAFVVQQVEAPGLPDPGAAYQGLQTRVEACIEAGQFRSGDVQVMAQSLWAAVHGITSLLVQKPMFPWASPSELVSQVIDSAVEGLRARKVLERQEGKK